MTFEKMCFMCFYKVDHNLLTSKFKDAMKETMSCLNTSIGSGFYVNARNVLIFFNY